MSQIDLKSLENEKIVDFIESFDTLITDCDGILWTRSKKLENTSSVINILRRLGKKIFFTTKSTTRTRKEVLKTYQKMGFYAEEKEILSTPHLVAQHLKTLDIKGKVYLIGSEAIDKEIRKVGYECLELGPDNFSEKADIDKIKLETEVGAVVLGFDEHINFKKITKAVNYLKDSNVHFIGCNGDENFKKEKIVFPGIGAFLKSIVFATGRAPTIVGKPSYFIRELLKKDFGVVPKRTLLIGDRDSDAKFAAKCGFKFLLVLSGAITVVDFMEWDTPAYQSKYDDTKRKKLEEAEPFTNFYIDQLGDLLPMLEKYLSNKNR